jgi:carboxyl-terminal processing protease
MKPRIGYTLLILAIAVDLLVGGKVLLNGRAQDADAQGANPYALFARALEIVRRDYVDPAKVQYSELVHSALQGMLTQLDPHSFFLDRDEYRESEEENLGEVIGIGVVVSLVDRVVTVVSTVEDAPAANAGILPGDQIRAVNNVLTTNKRLDDVSPLLRGTPGKPIRLTIYRPSTKTTLDVEVTRTLYKVTTVRDAHLIDGENDQHRIGYIRITEFNQPTPAELGEKLDDLMSQGMQALVLDLRYNPGGLVQSAIDTCGLFLPPRSLVVYTEGRDPGSRQEFFTNVRGKPRKFFPLAILVNAESASASEIVAGALRDQGRAFIVGETTFGKGVVQAQFPLPDGSGIHFTVARYFTPSRQAIQEHGVTPDIQSVLSPADERALLLKRRGVLFSDEEKNLVAHAHDNQLDRAVDALRGWLYYTS